MTTEQRITRLERTVATWKRAAIGLAAVCMCIVGMGQIPFQQDGKQVTSMTKMNQLTLTDKEGNVALIILGEKKGLVSIKAPESEAFMTLGIDNESATFQVHSGNGMSVAATANKKSATLGLNDQNVKGATRILLLANRNSPTTSAVAVFDKYGDTVWQQLAK